MDRSLFNLIRMKSLWLGKQPRTSSTFTRHLSLVSWSALSNLNYLLFLRSMEKSRRIPELTTQNLMVSCFAHRLKKTKVATTHHFSWWPGRTEKFCRNQKMLDLYLCTTWTVTCRGPSLTSSALVLKVLKYCRRHPVMLCWCGPRIWTILQEKATMESILFSMLESTKERTEPTFQFLITKFRTSSGIQEETNSS